MNPSTYIGKGWEAGARGPDKFDCWGLLVDIYKRHKGIDLPMYASVSREALSAYSRMISGEAESQWRQIDKPAHLCAVAMSQSVNFIHHVGIFLDIDGGRVIHAHRGSGVIMEGVEFVKSNWNLCKFYELRH